MNSFYADLAKEFIKELNNAFIANFGLLSEYQYDGINPGDRYGIVSVRNLTTNKSRKAGSQVRGGCQFLLFNLDILFTIGGEGRIDTEAEAAKLMLNLHDGIPRLKESLNYSIFDLQTDETFTCNFRQALGTPHNWIADLTCSATADLAIFVDIKGFHVLPPEKSNYAL